eukprot:XP_015573227.1 uncharacterized protein LOC107261072 [Ricinus communis]
MDLPPSFQPTLTNMVYKLKKSLYGLKQASRQWNEELTVALHTQKFKQAPSDSSLFTKGTGSNFIASAIYVDDIVLASSEMTKIVKIKGFLHDTFQIKNLGEIKSFFGLEVARSKIGINLCQRKYTLDLLQEIDFLGAKPILTPITSTEKLSRIRGQKGDDPCHYETVSGLSASIDKMQDMLEIKGLDLTYDFEKLVLTGKDKLPAKFMMPIMNKFNRTSDLKMMNQETFIDLYDDGLYVEEKNDKRKTVQTGERLNYQAGGSRTLDVNVVQDEYKVQDVDAKDIWADNESDREAEPMALYMESTPIRDKEQAILFSRPLMATTRTVIDVYNGKLTMIVLGEIMEFKIFDSLTLSPKSTINKCSNNYSDSLVYEQLYNDISFLIDKSFHDTLDTRIKRMKLYLKGMAYDQEVECVDEYPP